MSRPRPLCAFAAALILGACSGAISSDERRDEPDDPSGATPGAKRPAGGTTSNAPGTPGAAAGAATTPGAPGAATPPGGSPGSAGQRLLRRLTREEHLNTLRDLLPGVSLPALDLEPDVEGRAGFFEAPDIASSIAEKYLEAAEAIAERAVSSTTTLGALLGCDAAAAATNDAACLDKLVGDFATRAYRRPLEAEERTALRDLYATARMRHMLDWKGGARVVLTAMLQSPRFLYHGNAQASRSAVTNNEVALDGYDLGARLSYLAWRSMPDAALLTAAGAGKLTTDKGLGEELTRLLAHERAQGALASFHTQWLEATHLRTLEKDAATFKDWSPTLAAAMADELRRFTSHVIVEGDGGLGTLLTAPFTFANDALAKLYGLPVVTGKEPKRVELAGTPRAGLLTQGAFLATSSNQANTNPMRRGNTLLTQILCRELPPPPPDAAANFKFDDALSRRKNFERIAETAACAGCHRPLNAAGFAFDAFDAIGRVRQMDGKAPIDASGTLELDGKAASFDGAAAFSRALAASDEVRACYARQWTRSALARRDDADEPLARTLAVALGKPGGVRELLSTLVTSRSFRNRALTTMEVLR
jgi:hypothetical protein